MKKSIITIGLIAMLAVGSLCLTACADNTPKDIISVETVKSIALNNLNTDASLATFEKINTEQKQGVTYYDAEFTIYGVKYEYKINAADGTIAKVEINDQTVDVATAPAAPSNPDNDYIGIEAAKVIALADANVTATDVNFTEQKCDYDDGMYLYEFDFTVGTTEYEYEIVAKTGFIHKKEIDKVAEVIPVPSNSNITYKTVDEIKAIVIGDLSAQIADVTFGKIEFELDNGAHVFEVEVLFNAKEYEYEINATTGAIVEKSVDGDNALVPSVSTGEYIGTENAKAIALAHAGFNASQVTEYEGKLEVEGGIYVYSIEFKNGGFEYEYDINASTGAIVKVDKEFD